MLSPFIFLLLLLISSPCHSAVLGKPDSSKLKGTDSAATAVSKKSAIVITVKEQVDPGMAYFLKRAIQQAQAENPDIIIFKINTFGGRLDAAFDIVDAITSIKTCSTYAYIDLKAISAGALIALACNRIVMGNQTTIGDCAPIIQGQEGIKMAGEKIESPLRAKFRNLAEKNGYPSLLAQSMVSINMHIYKVVKNGKTEYLTKQTWDDFSKKEKKAYSKKKTIVAEGQLLTMTDSEAFQYGFSQGSFGSLESFTAEKDWQVETNIKTNWSEELVRAIGKIAPILMLLGFGALYMEFKTPGFGIFGIIGIVCLLIVFGSKYMAGLADHTELLLLLGGAVLIFTEIYFLPGTLIFGIAGLGLIIISLVLSLQAFTLPDPSMPWEKEILMRNLLLVLSMAIASLVIPFLGVKYLLPHMSRRSGIISATTMESARIHSIAERYPEIQPGVSGRALTMLRPFGKVEIGGRRFEAAALSGYIDSGKPVQVVSVKGNKIEVRESAHG